MFLRLRNLTKVFAGRGGEAEVVAADNVNIDIEEGEFLTLLGPSGCGKTTTLRLIAGFEFPTQGEIVLDGKRINDLPPNKRDMSMVFQSYAIFPHLSVFENIAYGLKIKQLSRDKIKQQVAEVLRLTELTGLENRAPNQLSGGQQQRVALARALVMEPKVLLLDEPLSNLDAKLRDQMRTEIRRIQQTLGITSVYVTHDQIEAMTLSDRIVVMNKGRVEQTGGPADIYRHPASAFVADFIGHTNFVPGTVVESRNGRLNVEALGQTLSVLKPEHELQPGDVAQLVVRPEMVQIEGEYRHYTGVVRRASFLGDRIEYDVEIDGERIAAIEYDPRRMTIHPEGSAISIGFLEDHIYVLPRDA
ncbi:MAG: Maltose/maltodextrin import ATP-binding protein MalK [Anaerolineales bacterium]|nr:Maltose/maltodextrin import ATP-binding protein MalK [Anaerolineales bacterium]